MKPLILAIFLAIFTSQSIAADLKLGVFDADAAMQESIEFKEFNAIVKAEAKPKIDEINQLIAELKALEAKFEKDGAVMSSEERSKFNQKVNDLKQTREFRARQFREFERKKMIEFTQLMQPKLAAALKQISDESGYDLLLPAKSLFYFNQELDITAQLIEKLNQLSTQ